MRFTSLSKRIVLSEQELRALGQLYPYDAWSYKDLAKQARAFLAAHFQVWKPYMKVIAISDHNGHGRQWGIILFQYPYDGRETWDIVAQFGHRPGSLTVRVWFARWLSRYLGRKNPALNRPLDLGSLRQL